MSWHSMRSWRDRRRTVSPTPVSSPVRSTMAATLRAMEEGARASGDGARDGSNDDAPRPTDVPIILELPECDLAGDWKDAVLERAYQDEHMLPLLYKHLTRGGMVLLCVSSVFTVVSFLSFGLSFALTLAASTWLLALVLVLVGTFGSRAGLPLAATEAVTMLLLGLLLAIPLTPTRLSSLMQSVHAGVRVRLDNEGDLQLVTIRFAVILLYSAIFVQLRPRRFAVVLVFTCISSVAQELILAPGLLATNARDSVAIIALHLLAYFARKHVWAIDRAQWHFHRRVGDAVREQYAKEREDIHNRLELAKVTAGKEARSKLIRVAMHDLRSPLLSVHSLSKTLEALPEDTPLHHITGFVRALGALSQLMEGIVSDMLDFERIDSGRITLVKRPLFLADVLGGVRATFETVAAGKGIDFRIEPLPAVLAAPHAYEGDAGRLAQVLNNGCSNAVKFTEAGGSVRISAWLAPEPPAGKGKGWDTVHVRVSDTGTGLSAAELKKLQDGDLFVQVGRGQLQGNGGTGLGLSIAMELLKLHDDSELRLRSAGPGQGTDFELVLNLKRALPPAGSASDPASFAGAGALCAPAADRPFGALCAPAADRPLASRSTSPAPFRHAVSDMEQITGTATTMPPPGNGGTLSAPLTPVAHYQVASPPPPMPATAPSQRRRLSRPPPSAPAPSVPPGKLRFPPGFRCLHVEDDKFVQMTLPLATFELLGAAYDTANDGEQALRMVEETQYDFILIDNQMPNLGGTETTRLLRERGFVNTIIGLTGDPEGSDDRDAFERAGLDACVDKNSKGTDFIVSELRKLAHGDNRVFEMRAPA